MSQLPPHACAGRCRCSLVCRRPLTLVCWVRTCVHNPPTPPTPHQQTPRSWVCGHRRVQACAGHPGVRREDAVGTPCSAPCMGEAVCPGVRGSCWPSPQLPPPAWDPLPAPGPPYGPGPNSGQMGRGGGGVCISKPPAGANAAAPPPGCRPPAPPDPGTAGLAGTVPSPSPGLMGTVLSPSPGLMGMVPSPSPGVMGTAPTGSHGMGGGDTLERGLCRVVPHWDPCRGEGPSQG